MRKYITSDIACLIYKQTILPLSDYADLVVVLGPPDKISRLQKMQDRAVRIINDGMHRNLDVYVIANLFSLTPLKLRRAEHLSLIMFRLKSDQTLIHQARPKIHLRERNKTKFKSYKRQNERFLSSPISRGITMWDRIPLQVQRSTTKVKFKRDIKPYLTRSGLTQNLEPARECRTFPTTGTLNGPSSWNDHTKLRISTQLGIS